MEEAQRRAAGRSARWEAEKKEREKKNSLSYKKSQSSQIGYQKTVSQQPTKQEQEKQRQKNREQSRQKRWEATQKDAYKYDSQFTADYFNNKDYDRIAQSDFDSLDFKGKAEYTDLMRKAQAGWNYRSDFEGVDENVNPTTEALYNVNTGANTVRDISWVKGASEEDIRWLISDLEKRVAEVGKNNKSRYKANTQADLDAVKDYAVKNFASFSNEKMRGIGDEIAKLDADYSAQQKHNDDLIAAANDVIKAGNAGYGITSYVASKPELQQALGYDELATKYSDPMDLEAELWNRANEIVEGGNAEAENNAAYQAYADERTELQKQLDDTQAIYADRLTFEKYQKMLDEK